MKSILEEYHQPILLLTSNTKRATNYLKKLERENSTVISNVKVISYSAFAKECFLSKIAKEGITEIPRILSEEEGNVLFRALLLRSLEQCSYFTDANMLNVATVKEIYQKCNLIRKNGWIKEEKENNRILDLQKMIQQYEVYLSQHNYYDSISLFHDVLAHIDDIQTSKILYFKEEKEELSGMELELLNHLSPKEELQIFDLESLSVRDLTDLNGKVSFFTGKGSFNEAMFLAYDILQKKIPFGNVHVLYSSSNQMPILDAVFHANGISVTFISRKRMDDNAYFSLVRRIFAWVKDDYSEKALEGILASPIIRVENDVLDGFHYYDHVIHAQSSRTNRMILGWGFQRNVTFVQRQMKQIVESQKEEDKLLLPVYQLHQALLEIFMDENGQELHEVEPIILLGRMMDFIKTYTKQDSSYHQAMDEFEKMKKAIFFEERKLSLLEGISWLEELLSSRSTSETQKPDMVACEQLTDWTIVERPNVYMVGLSLKELRSNTTESAVLTDEEIENRLKEGYRPTILKEASRHEQALYRTLKLMDVDALTLGFSSYDSVAIARSNPSIFFKEMVKQFASTSIKGLPEFVVGNPSKERQIKQSKNRNENTDFEFLLPISSSSTEALMKCPRSFAYQRFYQLPTDEYREMDSSGWLNAAERGSFFHSLMERYGRKEFYRPGKKAYAKKVNEKALQKITDEILEETLQEVPVAFRALAEQEIQDYLEYAKKYFEGLHESLNKDGSQHGWRLLAFEQGFQKATYTIQTLSNKKYSFTYSGSIDRIDYKILEDEQKILLRVVDYKSGSKKRKEEEEDKGALFQYVLYQNAVMNSGMCGKTKLLDVLLEEIMTLEENKDLKNWELQFDYFIYEFPADSSADSPLEIFLEEELTQRNHLRLQYIFTLMETLKTYPDVWMLEEGLSSYPSVQTQLENTFLDKDASACKYCSYQDICVNRKAGLF